MNIIKIGDFLTIYSGILMIKEIGSGKLVWFGTTAMLEKDHPYRDLEIQRVNSINKDRVAVYVSNNI